MRIAHITDFHYSKAINHYDFDNLFQALLEGLKIEHMEKKIDLIFITGDLVDKGGRSFAPDNHYDIIQNKILEVIAKDLGLSRDRIILIPGNHDVCEKSDGELFYLKGLRGSIDIPAVNKLIDENLTDWKNAEISGLKQFKEFEKSYYNSLCDNTTEIDHSNFETCFTFSFGNAKIGVAAFNSSWSCSTELDKTAKFKLAFGTSQIIRATTKFKNKTDFNIALLHHPINMDLYDEQEEAEMKILFSLGNFSMLFCGHTHTVTDTYVKEPDASYYLIVTKAGFNTSRTEEEKYKSGFSLIDLSYISDDQIKVSRHYRKYLPPKKRFDFDVEQANRSTSAFELKPRTIGRNFIKYLKSQNVLFDVERKVLFETINSISQNYIKSTFPKTTDLALKKSIERFLPKTNQFNSIRKNLKLDWEISFHSDGYYYLKENQSFEILSTIDPVQFSSSIYVDTILDGKDKTDMKITEFYIAGENMLDKFVLEMENLPKDGTYGRERKRLDADVVLQGKESYMIQRKFEIINSLATKKAYTYKFINIIEGFKINISDPASQYHVELFGIGTDLYYSNKNKEGEILKEISISQPSEILIPGDEFWLFVSYY